GQPGDVSVLEFNRTAIGAHHADDHVEGGGFAGAIGPEQADDFSAANLYTYTINDAALAIFFDQVFGGEEWFRAGGCVRRADDFCSQLHESSSCKGYLENKRPGLFVPLSGASPCPITLLPRALRVLCARSQIKARASVIRPMGVSAVGLPLNSTTLLLAV